MKWINIVFLIVLISWIVWMERSRTVPDVIEYDEMGVMYRNDLQRYGIYGEIEQ